MIRDFIAIDFETANQQPSSVCSVGVVMVRNGLVADSFYSLIQPVATTSRTIIMHWPMLKPVLP
jgi:DNA polymerase III epsilon subunit-like protein